MSPKTQAQSIEGAYPGHVHRIDGLPMEDAKMI